MTNNRVYGQTLISLGSGATFKEIPKTTVGKFEIPLPPLPTQHKIVEILEEADNLRKLRQQADEKMKDLIPSLFIKMFGDPVKNPKGWKVKKLEEICNDFQNGVGKNKESYGSGVKVANISDLYDSFRFAPIHFSSINVSQKEIEQYRLNKGDILFVRSSVKREGVAVCSAYDSDELCLFGSFMIRMMPMNKIIHPYYLSCCLRTEQMRTRLINSSNTVAITNIAQPALKKFKVPLPPLPLQQEFAKLVEDIEAEKARQAESRKKLNELFQSLMQRAFTGELVA
jgi:type I restriction enzyme S subunit